MTRAQMGLLEIDLGRPLEAGESFRAAIVGLESCNDPRTAARAAEEYFRLWARGSPDDRRTLEAKWSEDGLGEFPRAMAMQVAAQARGGTADNAKKT